MAFSPRYLAYTDYIEAYLEMSQNLELSILLTEINLKVPQVI